MGKGVTAQTTAGNPKKHTPRRKASPTMQEQEHTNKAPSSQPRQETPNEHWRGGNRATHTTSKSPKCRQSKIRRPLPDTRDRRNKSTAPTATTEAPGKPPSAQNATWRRRRQSRRHTNNTTTPTVPHTYHRGATVYRPRHRHSRTWLAKKRKGRQRCSCGERLARWGPSALTPSAPIIRLLRRSRYCRNERLAR